MSESQNGFPGSQAEVKLHIQECQVLGEEWD